MRGPAGPSLFPGDELFHVQGTFETNQNFCSFSTLGRGFPSVVKFLLVVDKLSSTNTESYVPDTSGGEDVNGGDTTMFPSMIYCSKILSSGTSQDEQSHVLDYFKI